MAPEIVISSSDGSSRTLKLDKDRITLGRSGDNDLAYPDDHGLSRRHMAIEKNGREWVVHDQNSKNGTLVNGIRISGPTSIEPGDRVSAGHLVITFADPAPSVSHETVVFVDGGMDTPSSSTVITSLDGLYRNDKKITSDSTPGGTPRPAVSLTEQQRYTQTLGQVSAMLAAHLPLTDLFRMVMDQSMLAAGASRGVLMTFDQSENLVVRETRGDAFRISSTVRERVMRDRQSLLVRDTSLDAAVRGSQSIVDNLVRSFMAVPLQTNDQNVIGLLYLDSSLLKEFTKEDLNMITMMANIAAVRIEAARAAEVEGDMKAAGDIQRGLLPSRPPVVPGIDLAGYNVPCRTVGGDYYDFLPYPDGRVAIIVADVAGKGMPAALLMSSLQARVQVLVEDAPDLASMVTRLNRVITSTCPSNRFITFFMAVLEPTTGETVYCNAGHNPPLLVRANGDVETLEGGGMILGILPKAQYSERRTQLDPGDVLVLFSDGVTEGVKAGTDEEFGEDRLAAAIQRSAKLPATEMIDAINREVAEWAAGTAPADDVTLVVVRRKGL
ncbi:MAG: SpoIIE family protein phosphatase [Acidobacteria bacterium]|nr:SpoIIE family protein phosphatase [Acidobacteriota bacterium]